jgi:hypothetical protein
MYQVVVPMIFVLSRSPTESVLIKRLRPIIQFLHSPQLWQGWEQFNAKHHALLNYCWSVYRGYVSLHDFYAGAVIGDSVPNVELVLPRSDNDVDFTDFVSNERFPAKDEECSLQSLFLGGRVMLNAAGSGVDAVTVSVTKSGVPCVRLLLMAHTIKGTELTNEKINDDIQKALKSVDPYLESYLSKDGNSKSLVTVSVALSNRVVAKRFTAPSNSIVVSEAQLNAFFGCSIGPHIRRMLKKSERERIMS